MWANHAWIHNTTATAAGNGGVSGGGTMGEVRKNEKKHSQAARCKEKFSYLRIINKLKRKPVAMINVFHIVSNKIWSGPEQYAFDLALRLRNDDNYYVEVVCKKSESVFNKFRSLEIPVSILPLKGLTDLDSPVRFARLLKRGQNIIHVHTFHDAFAAIWAKHIAENPNTRIVLTLHGVNRPRINYLSKKVYRDLDRIVFVSQRSYDEFVPRITRLDRKKCVIVRDSVLPARSEKLARAPRLRQELGIDSDQVLIMYHGRLSHDKGLDVLLRAITQLDRNKFHLVILGEGNRKYVAQQKAFIVANQLVQNVDFLGFSDNVQSFITQCDFGVLPSVVPEALGLSNLEYMMHGKAHIATNNGAQLEYLENGKNALLVDPDNPYELAQAIEQLIADAVLRSRIGMQAQHDFNDHLNYDTFYQHMTALYTSLFKAPGA